MTLLVKNLLFTVLLPGTAAVYVPLLIAHGRSPASVWVVALALPAFAVGGAIYAWCVWDFATFGRGTPLPIDAPKRLVVRGLYRYTRNPMYVGVLTVISGWALLFQTGVLVGYLLLVGTGFHLFVVLYEERHLHKVFGDEYDAYRNRVGRWLPKFGRRPAALALLALVGMAAAPATDGRAVSAALDLAWGGSRPDNDRAFVKLSCSIQSRMTGPSAGLVGSSG